MVLNLDGGRIQLRPGQAEAVAKIKSAFERGVKTVFLDAPVGSGKSLINLLVARDMRGAYISTSQVILVNQYGADTAQGAKFSRLAQTLYGRRNYPCTYLQSLSPEDGGRPYATASGAPCTYLPRWPVECPSYSVCPYYSAKRLAQGHLQTVTTMAYLLTGIRNGLEFPSSGWRERPLLIVDEAHGLAEELVRHFKAEIGPGTLPGFTRKWLSSPGDPRFQLIDALPAYIAKLHEVLSELYAESKLTPKIRDRIQRLRSAASSAEDILWKLNAPGVEWVHTFDARSEKHSWRALAVKNLMSRFWTHFNGILLSSATFFGTEALRRDCGLPEPHSRVVVQDTFDPARAPVRLLGAVHLAYKIQPLEIERVADAVTAVARAHPNERGVVHSNSYYLANAIRRELPADVRERLTSHDPLNRTRRYTLWRQDPSPTSIFFAVAMSQGIDLVGEMARWQVLVKVPFPSLGDIWVRRRLQEEDGQQWYSARTIVEVLQASGRIMRDAGDHGTTYVIDAQIDRLLDGGWPDLPEWFRRRVEAGRRIRTALPGRFGDYAVRSAPS